VHEEGPAASVYDVAVVSVGLLRRAITSLFSLLSLTSSSATLPQWRRYDIRDRRSGTILRSVNDDVNGRDVEAELRRGLAEMTPVEFALRWKLPDH
jgi:hypothetical protein